MSFRQTWIVFLLLTSIGNAQASPAKRHRQAEGPLLALIVPAEGARVNVSALHVTALVAARQPDRTRTFRFYGESVTGRQAGVIDAIEIRIDGVLVRAVDPNPCRRQFVVDEVIPVAGLNDGTHVIEIIAGQGRGRPSQVTRERRTFVIDRTLPVAERNRIEEAASPKPFGCLAVRDSEDAEDDEGPATRHPEVHGRFVLGALSDGIDLSRDRVVVAAGGVVRVLEPGSLTCNRSGVCRHENRFDAFLQRVVLEQRSDRLWKFRVIGGSQWPRDAMVHLRIGNDWGAIDLATGERLAELQLDRDESLKQQATIGPAGGTIAGIDQRGVTIALTIPAGALTRDTLISLTPLASSPLGGGTLSIPGVQFAPKGLVFAKPATLTFDFAASGLAVGAGDAVLWMTSPLTALPLPGHANPDASTIVASVNHFSPFAPAGPGANAALVDRVAWANVVLASPAPLNIPEIASLLAVVADQLLSSCTVDCLDIAAVTAKVEQSVETAVAAECANPAAGNRATLQRLVALEALVQLVGGSVTILPCIDAILGGMVNGLVGPPATTAANDPFLVAAKEVADTAAQFNFPNRAAEALAKLAQGLRSVVSTLVEAAQTARGTPEEEAVLDGARTDVQRAQLWVTTIAPATIGVDPGISLFLQAALNSLESGVMTVAAQNGRINCVGGDEGVPAPWLPIPPLVQVSPNVFEWSVEFGYPCPGGTLVADLAFSTPGVLTITAETSWFPPPVNIEGYGNPFNGGYVWVFDTTQDYLCQRSATWIGCAFPTATEVSIRVPAGLLPGVQFEAAYLNTATWIGAQTATGRLLTVRFTPQP